MSDDDQQRHKQNHHCQRPATLAEHTQIRLETNGSEEQHHADVLDGPVEIQIDPGKAVKRKGKQRDDKPAGNGSRYAKTLQDRNGTGKEHSQEQGRDAHSRRHVHIHCNAYHFHACRPADTNILSGTN